MFKTCKYVREDGMTKLVQLGLYDLIRSQLWDVAVPRTYPSRRLIPNIEIDKGRKRRKEKRKKGGKGKRGKRKREKGKRKRRKGYETKALRQLGLVVANEVWAVCFRWTSGKMSDEIELRTCVGVGDMAMRCMHAGHMCSRRGCR